MTRDDLFRRSFEFGTGFLGMTRERAEAFVKHLVKTGDIQKKNAQKAVDDLVERSRKATEDLRKAIGQEIREQLSAAGVATKDDIKVLEERIDALVAATKAASTRKPASSTED